MLKLGRIETALEGMAYFGIQSPLLQDYNLAHHINKFFDIKLAKTGDFEKYDVKANQPIPFSAYRYVSEIEQCSYYLIENKNGSHRLFSNHSHEDFWFLVQFENGLNDRRFHALREKLYNNLVQIDDVFSVSQIEPKKLANFKDFKDDFLEYCTKLLAQKQ